MHIRSITVSYFRNHKQLEISPQPGFVVISGPNGSGKTNILESISLLAPGKGLRNCKFDEIFPNDNQHHSQWAVNCNYVTSDRDINIITGCSQEPGGKISKRIMKIDGEIIKKQANILNIIRVIWLIPQMDGLFLDSPSARRKFLDRLSYNLYPHHVQDVNRYDLFLKSRSKILSESHYDEVWLSNIEYNIAQLGVKIAGTRVQSISKVCDYLNKSHTSFLKPFVKIVGFIEEHISQYSENNLIDLIVDKLKRARSLDAITKRCSIGVHKSDLEVIHPYKQLNAKFCSTGEQKAMLTALILSQVQTIRNSHHISPILLLDEVFAHLDHEKKQALIEEIHDLSVQTWITTTDDTLCAEIKHPVSHLNLIQEG